MTDEQILKVQVSASARRLKSACYRISDAQSTDDYPTPDEVEQLAAELAEKLREFQEATA